MGVSYEVSDIVFDLRYVFGLTKVNKKNALMNKEGKNQVIQFTVGYKFKL